MVKLTGVSKDTLRYYEDLGILSPNRESYARQYSEKDLERLDHIKQLKALNFSLNEIQQMVTFDEQYTSIEEIEHMPEQDREELLLLLNQKMKRAEENIQLLEEGLERLITMIQKLKSL